MLHTLGRSAAALEKDPTPSYRERTQHTSMAGFMANMASMIAKHKAFGNKHRLSLFFSVSRMLPWVWGCSFITWALQTLPSKEMSLCQIDVGLGYEPPTIAYVRMAKGAVTISAIIDLIIIFIVCSSILLCM